ncbi:MAG: hypothetical protein FJW20_08765 [Acidimicrobiia bacterium]|nr:hypothetical protein [Acidimicrobiia bacterium]
MSQVSMFSRLRPRIRHFLGIPAALNDVRRGSQLFVHSPQFLALPAAMMIAGICGTSAAGCDARRI